MEIVHHVNKRVIDCYHAEITSAQLHVIQVINKTLSFFNLFVVAVDLMEVTCHFISMELILLYLCLGSCFPCPLKQEVKCFCGSVKIAVNCGAERWTRPPKCRLPCRLELLTHLIISSGLNLTKRLLSYLAVLYNL